MTRKQNAPTRAYTPWDLGYEAAQAGQGEDANIFDRNTDSSRHLGWRSGWYDYMYQDPEENYCGGY